jgi:hypothetical protein
MTVTEPVVTEPTRFQLRVIKHLYAKGHENPTKGAGANAGSQMDGRGLT